MRKKSPSTELCQCCDKGDDMKEERKKLVKACGICGMHHVFFSGEDICDDCLAKIRKEAGLGNDGGELY